MKNNRSLTGLAKRPDALDLLIFNTFCWLIKYPKFVFISYFSTRCLRRVIYYTANETNVRHRFLSGGCILRASTCSHVSVTCQNSEKNETEVVVVQGFELIRRKVFFSFFFSLSLFHIFLVVCHPFSSWWSDFFPRRLTWWNLDDRKAILTCITWWSGSVLCCCFFLCVCYLFRHYYM